ncbi:MAG: WXG100 family type VII secretion target [Actinomyces succiniciruminis]|nr:WXG100 family type VII secretion target [Actinomyces succiniciruminis]
MTITLTATKSFTPEPYYQAARGLATQGRAVKDVADGITSVQSIATEDWRGAAATAFIAHSDSVTTSAKQLATNLNRHADLLTWYASAKNTVCERAVSAAQQMEAAGFDVSDNWKLSLSDAQKRGTGRGFLIIQMAAMQVTLNAFVQAICLVDTQASAQLTGSGPATPLSPQDVPYATSNGYTTGDPPDRTINFDDYFPFGSKRGEATQEDLKQWLKWEAMLRGGQMLRPDLDDSLPMYEHFRDASGTPMTFDLEEGYREDASIRNEIDGEMNEVVAAANELAQNGYTDTEFHSQNKTNSYTPVTENWQKTVGGYTYYSDSNLKVEGDTITVTTTITARDRWNFNEGEADIATGTPDSVNGRFEELGWAQSFDTSGAVTRTVSWKVGEEPPNFGDDTSQDVGGWRNDESRDRNDWRGGWDNGGGRYPRHEPGGDDKLNRFPDGRGY